MCLSVVMETDGVTLAATAPYNGECVLGFLASDKQTRGGLREGM